MSRQEIMKNYFIRFLFLFSFVFSAFFLESCKSTKVEETLPDWVTVERADETGYYAVGSANLGDYNKSYKLAVLNAKKAISAMIKTEVNSLVDVKRSDNKKNESVQLTTEASLTSSEKVSKTTVLKTYQAKGGTVYVLVHSREAGSAPETKVIDAK